MMMLPVVVIVGAIALGSYVSAQDAPSAPKPVYTAEAMRARISGNVPGQRCFLPDRAERAVNTTVTVEGKSYRCVAVLDWSFQQIGVAWTPVQQP